MPAAWAITGTTSIAQASPSKPRLFAVISLHPLGAGPRAETQLFCGVQRRRLDRPPVWFRSREKESHDGWIARRVNGKVIVSVCTRTLPECKTCVPQSRRRTLNRLAKAPTIRAQAGPPDSFLPVNERCRPSTALLSAGCQKSYCVFGASTVIFPQK